MTTALPHACRIPLDDATKKKRQALVIASAVAVTVVKAGIVPSKVEALGIEFGSADKGAMLGMLLAVIAYFLFGFVFYVFYDLLDVRADFYRQQIAEHLKSWEDGPGKLGHVPAQVVFYRQKLESPSFKIAFVLRFLYDCLLPAVLGVYAGIITLGSIRSFI